MSEQAFPGNASIANTIDLRSTGLIPDDESYDSQNRNPVCRIQDLEEELRDARRELAMQHLLSSREATKARKRLMRKARAMFQWKMVLKEAALFEVNTGPSRNPSLTPGPSRNASLTPGPSPLHSLMNDAWFKVSAEIREKAVQDALKQATLESGVQLTDRALSSGTPERGFDDGGSFAEGLTELRSS